MKYLKLLFVYLVLWPAFVILLIPEILTMWLSKLMFFIFMNLNKISWSIQNLAAKLTRS